MAGVDEAGRGPLAGPVVAAACILPIGHRDSEIGDSKQLTSIARTRLYEKLLHTPGVEVAFAVVSAAEIDRINILQATLQAMLVAVRKLEHAPDYLLVDGPSLPRTRIPAQGVIGGDGICLSIAAASVVAKVERDLLMQRLDELYPGYGFATHKGYGTAAHLEALARLGPCAEHRRSFAPVAKQKTVACRA